MVLLNLLWQSNSTKSRLVFILEALRKLLIEPEFLSISWKTKSSIRCPRTWRCACMVRLKSWYAVPIFRCGWALRNGTAIVRLADIQPLKLVSEEVKRSPKYRQIAASVAEIGLVEPPVVARSRDSQGKCWTAIYG